MNLWLPLLVLRISMAAYILVCAWVIGVLFLWVMQALHP